MPLEEPQSGWAFGGWSWSQANLDVVVSSSQSVRRSVD